MCLPGVFLLARWDLLGLHACVCLCVNTPLDHLCYFFRHSFSRARYLLGLVNITSANYSVGIADLYFSVRVCAWRFFPLAKQATLFCEAGHTCLPDCLLLCDQLAPCTEGPGSFLGAAKRTDLCNATGSSCCQTWSSHRQSSGLTTATTPAPFQSRSCIAVWPHRTLIKRSLPWPLSKQVML